MSEETPRYSLGHVLSQSSSAVGGYKTKTTNYSATPIVIEIPKKGKIKQTFVCSYCQNSIDVFVRSRMLIIVERLKHLGWGLAGMGIWSFSNYLSDRYGFNMGDNSCLLIPILFIFLILAYFIYYHLAKVLFKDFDLMFEIFSSNHIIVKEGK